MILDQFSLKGKTVLITGGEGFLGKMICETVRELDGNALSIDITGEPYIICDLNNPYAILSMAKNIEKADILVNNAVGNQKPVDNPADGWRDDISIGSNRSPEYGGGFP